MDQVGTGHPSFELLSAYHDAELAPAEHLRAAAHLDRCAACRKTLAGFDLLGMALRTVPAATCADLGRLLSAELDGETSTAETAVVTGHLTACAACRAKRASWQSLSVAIAALPAGTPSAAADARIRGLAHRRRRLLPTGPALGGGIVGRAAAALAAVALALVASLPRGAAIGPSFSAGPSVGEERPLVASMQQVLNPATNTLYVLRSMDGIVLAKNASTNAELAQISVGGRPTALALNAAANLVYVLDPTAKTYTTISGETNTVTATASVPLTGTLTSIQVNQSTGQLVIGATAIVAPSVAPSGPLGQLAIIDPASQKLETRSVDVAPTQVVLNAAANRMYLLGAKGTSVVDATTYATIATLPVAIAIAPSATGGADAILSSDGGRAKLSFYGTPAGATFDGTPINAVGLPDGSFAVLLDVGGSGRIQLVDRLGGAIGSLDVAGTASSLTFDPDAKRFLGPNGQVVATISGTSIALAGPTDAPRPSAPAATGSATPVPTAGIPGPSAPPAAETVPANPPSPSAAPATTAPIQGATLAAVGVYRYALPDGIEPVIVAGGGDRLWLVDQHSVLQFLDTSTGAINAVSVLRRDGAISRLVVTPTSVFALDSANAALFRYDIGTGKLTNVAVPFGRSITAMDVSPDGRVWLGASGYSGLLALDPRSGRFDLVPLAGSVSVAALTTDLAGQIWFIDGTNGQLDRYDPSSARLTQLQLPAAEAFVALRADTRGAVWIGTTGGAVYKLAAGALTRISLTGAPVVSLAIAPDGSVQVLAAAAQYTAAGPGTGGLTTAPAGVRSFAVDSAGRLWLADRTAPLFYIVEPQ